MREVLLQQIDCHHYVANYTGQHSNWPLRVVFRKDSWNDNLVAKVLIIARATSYQSKDCLVKEEVLVENVRAIFESLWRFQWNGNRSLEEALHEHPRILIIKL